MYTQTKGLMRGKMAEFGSTRWYHGGCNEQTQCRCNLYSMQSLCWCVQYGDSDRRQWRGDENPLEREQMGR